MNTEQLKQAAEANKAAHMLLKTSTILALLECVDALRMAVQQNDHDMLMTGEELRQCRAAPQKLEAMP
jgi:hypothetical protein